MKEAEYKKPINTIPRGVWESGRPLNPNETPVTTTTDLQGNGYPVQQPNITNDLKNENKTNPSGR